LEWILNGLSKEIYDGTRQHTYKVINITFDRFSKQKKAWTFFVCYPLTKNRCTSLFSYLKMIELRLNNQNNLDMLQPSISRCNLTWLLINHVRGHSNTFWPIFDPTPSPCVIWWHWYGPRPPTLWSDIFNFPKTRIWVTLIEVNCNFSIQKQLKRTNNVTWHFV